VLSHAIVSSAYALNMMAYGPLVKGKSISYDGKCHHMEGAVAEGLTNWEDRAKRLLRMQMAGKGFSYQRLVDELEKMGIKEDEHNLRNKVARGKFTAALLLQCLEAMQVWEVRIDR
jgi:hypothetical protein